ncbi:DUF2510 domain-containing protein [Microbacterium sp. NPDC057407]|uniref:DUF2510 domain-containing protein n=1 Tax=Microbacterium sp. NPDC057407 TaxID=3346120 RepID=UPI00366DE407
MATTPPGWYDDGHGAMRWWDGTSWTEHVATPDPVPDASAPSEADIVAANEAADAERAEVDPAVALGIGVPPAAGGPEFPQYSAGQPYGVPTAQAVAPEQAGYPAGYPGPDAAPGAFAAATEPRRSKLWILWVVLGVVLLGIVIAAAIVIPLLFLNLARGAGGAAGADAVQPQGADQQAAVAAVELFDDAWQSADCEAFEATTTEDFRVGYYGFEDCADFEESAIEFMAGAEDYVLTVTGIEPDGDAITVSTVETYDALLDESGEPLDEPEPQEYEYSYTVVPVDGGWAIDDLE